MHPLNKYRLHLIITGAAVLVGVAVFFMGSRGDHPPLDDSQGNLFHAKSSKVAENFSAHKALYEIKLGSTRSGSQIINIGGQMYYEWKPSCEAWLSDHRFNMHYEYADAPSMQLTSNFSTYESFDGKRFDFSSQRKTNGELFEEIRGSVQDDQAFYRLPDNTVLDLPDNTFFPVAHTIEVARQVQSGKTFKNIVLFDGSDLEGPVEVNSFIGGVAQAPEFLFKMQEIDADLLNAPAHKVRLAFFPMKEEQLTSDYEMDLIFHENGVISDMVVEYDDFTVTQKLIALEKIESTCAPADETL
ncbi:MAG: cell envelope integrity EipB family protein [Micavibrio sp.]|nr:cell envelope integrity EipB family protein [Micavibrio sp.]